MRIVMCYISILITSFSLVGCGQSGALQLASDQNYDKRAKYLLYRNKEQKQVVQQDEQAEQSVESSAAQPQTTSP